jgi:hypothetical protein
MLHEVVPYAYIISGMARRKRAFDGLSMSDGDLLEAALIGLERQRDSINEKMAALRERLGVRGGGRVSSVADMVSPDGAAPPRTRRRMSAAARRRIAAAQRKRWAALKQGSTAKTPASKTAPTKKKRKISAAGMKRIVAATKKRWAAYHAKKRAAGKKKSAA